MDSIIKKWVKANKKKKLDIISLLMLAFLFIYATIAKINSIEISTAFVLSTFVAFFLVWAYAWTSETSERHIKAILLFIALLLLAVFIDGAILLVYLTYLIVSYLINKRSQVN